jgi:hypothetical protein
VTWSSITSSAVAPSAALAAESVCVSTCSQQRRGASYHPFMNARPFENPPHPAGRHRTVWTIPTQRHHGAHFATFSERLVEPCVLAGHRRGRLLPELQRAVATEARDRLCQPGQPADERSALPWRGGT